MLSSCDDPTTDARHGEVRGELAAAMGALNAGFVRLLDVVEVVLAEDHHVGVGLRGPGHFLAWRTGMAIGRCEDLVRIVRRRDDLPCLYAALRAGEVTVDQAAVVARHVPAAYDESVTAFAKLATVAQLRSALPAYGFEAKPKSASAGISTGTDERGWFIRGRASLEQGAVIDQALACARKDLWRNASEGLPAGETPAAVTTADALVSLAEASLQAGEALRPGSDRYLVHVHLDQAPTGELSLSTTMGVELPVEFRRRLLCDATMAALVRRGLTDVSAGRTRRQLSRRHRRAIQRRDRGCAIPGCAARHGLEIHHIVHWEDGGGTDWDNLLTLCAHHHQLHHQGRLRIAGTASDLHLADHRGLPLDPVGHGDPPKPPPHTSPYRAPLGEPLHHRDVHFSPNPAA